MESLYPPRLRQGVRNASWSQIFKLGILLEAMASTFPLRSNFSTELRGATHRKPGTSW